MRKKVFGRKFARNTNSRKALSRSLIGALVENGQIETTKARAKAIQPEIDRLVTLAKRDTDHGRRLVMSRLANNMEVSKKLFSYYLPLFGSRTSGFTRIVNLPTRVGDRAELVRIEFVDKATKGDKSQAVSK